MRTLAEIRRFLGREPLRALGLALALLAALAVFLTQVDPHYPIEEWLFWHYAGYWACVLGWAAAVWGLGAFLLDRVFRIRFPLLEYSLIAFTLGQLGFCWALFLVGAAHGYNRVTFFALPFAIVMLTLAWAMSRAEKSETVRTSRACFSASATLSFQKRRALGVGSVSSGKRSAIASWTVTTARSPGGSGK